MANPHFVREALQNAHQMPLTKVILALRENIFRCFDLARSHKVLT